VHALAMRDMLQEVIWLRVATEHSMHVLLGSAAMQYWLLDRGAVYGNLSNCSVPKSLIQPQANSGYDCFLGRFEAAFAAICTCVYCLKAVRTQFLVGEVSDYIRKRSWRLGETLIWNIIISLALAGCISIAELIPYVRFFNSKT
jgi:hypothetical protein